ncbi:MAG: DUF1156 domain-containing protein [Thermoguttaceae bacterium]|jgi:putative DNA methylase
MAKIKAPKKLIEVALPLDEINAEAAREKSIRHGHPSTLHLWWARRPLAAARAVLFAQLVNDPGGTRGWKAGLTKEDAKKKRDELFEIIRDLVVWENVNNEAVLDRAREAIRESWRETCALNQGRPGFDPETLPAFHDPFAGGGAIPLEAQRLGLESHASDLNPVAVLINKAMIEIPPRFFDSPPVGPVPRGDTEKGKEAFSGTAGLAEDVRRYGLWIMEEAKKRIGGLYPDVEITETMAKGRPDLEPYVGQKLTVIAWLWARTVKSPHPDFGHVDVPLISSFVLCSKKGKEVYLEPVIEGDTYRFEVKVGTPPKGAKNGTKLGRGANFRCLMSGVPIEPGHIYSEAQSGNMGERLLAIVVEGDKQRVYLSPLPTHEFNNLNIEPPWKPRVEMPKNPRWFSPPGYGLKTYGDLFTPRQLTALNTFSDLVQEVREKTIEDAKHAGMPDDGIRLAEGGRGATAYGDAIAVYLAFVIDKLTDYGSTICSWHSSREIIRNTFGRQAIPMTWDYAEGNFYSDSTGSFTSMLDWVVKTIALLPAKPPSYAHQADAQTQAISQEKIVSTDPPYYDNIGYADLSDFFYIWLRCNLKGVYPDLFATLAAPKSEELVATPYRHGGKENAEKFFLDGMTLAMQNLAQRAHPAFPVTIYYAFKASDTNGDGTSNTGWATFLEAILKAGFSITGTWPLRTELSNRMIGMGTNALASSILLVCRKRERAREEISRREFLTELRETMPTALREMIGEGSARSIAPVDLAQAAIGPGMEIFSKYRAVLKADGAAMTVREALIEINRNISDYLDPEGSGFDAPTLFCNEWFKQNRWEAGEFGVADTLARAKGTSVPFVKEAGIIQADRGKVRLLPWEEYPDDYDPSRDKNRPIWESCHHLIRVLRRQGEVAAGRLLAQMPETIDGIRQLAYFLYLLCERKGDAENARSYNELITGWHGVMAAFIKASEELKRPVKREDQETLNFGD